MLRQAVRKKDNIFVSSYLVQPDNSYIICRTSSNLNQGSSLIECCWCVALGTYSSPDASKQPNNTNKNTALWTSCFDKRIEFHHESVLLGHDIENIDVLIKWMYKTFSFPEKTRKWKYNLTKTVINSKTWLLPIFSWCIISVFNNWHLKTYFHQIITVIIHMPNGFEIMLYWINCYRWRQQVYYK